MFTIKLKANYGFNIGSHDHQLFFFLCNAVSDAYKVSFSADWGLLVTWFEILGYGSLDYGVSSIIIFDVCVYVIYVNSYILFIFCTEFSSSLFGDTNLVNLIA